ncbi:Z-ring formation inhibitor MciZ [Paenibacillus sp.]|uniref:Z-ring formation inhibitor MciZ n=1 Tax=Paenibacillus sp. TaxID=58172 RepID=UPI002810E421|nr:Z-ring formation inhibitor MciZ [Paenibacillus sp.]
MKGYYGSKRLRLVGKGWEVREKLRQIQRQTDDPSTTLAAWLRQPPALRPALASASIRSAPAYSPRDSIADSRSYPMA